MGTRKTNSIKMMFVAYLRGMLTEENSLAALTKSSGETSCKTVTRLKLISEYEMALR